MSFLKIFSRRNPIDLPKFSKIWYCNFQFCGPIFVSKQAKKIFCLQKCDVYVVVYMLSLCEFNRRLLREDYVRVVFGHQMWVGFCLWAIELTRVVRKTPHFGIGIVWGAIPMSFPVFWINVSGRSLNSYGTSPNLWVQKELVKFRQCTQDTWLCFAKLLGEFLSYPPFNLLGDLGDVILG